MTNGADSVPKPHVALFATCLVDLFRPTVGFAALKLLRDAGCRVSIPRSQTCCGQPALNSGDRRTATAFARSVVKEFEEFDYVVVPSGSCAGTIVKDFPDLLSDDAEWGPAVSKFAEKTHELVSFLVDVIGVEQVDAHCEITATYHDSCSSLRTLGIREQPRKLLASVKGLELRPLREEEVCCGFGGMFCVKYPEISNAMVEAKAQCIEDTGVELLLAGDLGCLINMAGKLHRRESPVRARHVAEVLAGLVDEPAIGESS